MITPRSLIRAGHVARARADSRDDDTGRTSSRESEPEPASHVEVFAELA